MTTYSDCKTQDDVLAGASEAEERDAAIRELRESDRLTEVLAWIPRS